MKHSGQLGCTNNLLMLTPLLYNSRHTRRGSCPRRGEGAGKNSVSLSNSSFVASKPQAAALTAVCFGFFFFGFLTVSASFFYCMLGWPGGGRRGTDDWRAAPTGWTRAASLFWHYVRGKSRRDARQTFVNVINSCNGFGTRPLSTEGMADCGCFLHKITSFVAR